MLLKCTVHIRRPSICSPNTRPGDAFNLEWWAGGRPWLRAASSGELVRDQVWGSWVMWPPACHSGWGVRMANFSCDAPADVNEFFFLHLLSSARLCVHVEWLIHACGPWSLSAHTHVLALPGFACSRCTHARGSYTHLLNNTNRICVAASPTSAPPPLGFSQPVVDFLPVCVCLCQSALFCLALGGQPFSIPIDVPWKSVSRATRVPNTLPVASSLRVLYLHF